MNATKSDAMPWYREPWPWLLMAGPALLASLTAEAKPQE